MYKPILTAVAMLLVAGPLAADTPPPADAMPLSEILAQIEREPDFAYFDEIEWDDGRWEIEYYTDQGRKVKFKVDAVTAQVVR